jgi:hypothetical protein
VKPTTSRLRSASVAPSKRRSAPRGSAGRVNGCEA